MSSTRRLTKPYAFLVCTLLAVLLIPSIAYADAGPKASVNIRFENMGDELCYGTLLSASSDLGAYTAWDGTEESAVHRGTHPDYSLALDYDTWKSFVEYRDSDGYYFLQEGWNISETKEIDWSYCPPEQFKILLYYPETDTFVVSGIYERYAFHSYYTVDMTDVKITSEESATLTAHRSYRYGVEILALLARIIITILFEMSLAQLFGFTQKHQLKLLAIVNIVTQIILNVLLNVVNYKLGGLIFYFGYILLEFLVFIIESIVYCRLLKKMSDPPRGNLFYIFYSFVANAVSFYAGMQIATYFPGVLFF